MTHRHRSKRPQVIGLISLFLGLGLGLASTAHSASPVELAATGTASAPVRLAHPVTLDYAVEASVAGMPVHTEAKLVWRRDTQRYQASWTVRLPLVGERRQYSEGAIDEHGLVPALYTEHLRRERSAHMDHETGRVAFYDDRPDGKLQAGAQDRLTVSLQLGALIATAPKSYPAGTEIAIQTVGVRSTEIWRWRIRDDETLDIDGHKIDTVRLTRLPRKKNDSEIDLWLARTIDYLPARLRVTQSRGDTVDQRLKTLPAGR